MKVTDCNRCAWYRHQRIDKETGGLGNTRTKGDHLNYISKIDQNTEKSPGDLKRFVTQTPAEDRLLTLV